MSAQATAQATAPAAATDIDVAESRPAPVRLPSLTQAGKLTADFHRYVPSILTDVCQKGTWARNYEWIPLPERSPVFDGFFGDAPFEKVVKADMEPDPERKGKYVHVPTGQADIKARSAEGYVWVDGDPIAILANKYGNLRSCHTLDNGEYSAGNFAHLYNPYLGAIFAGTSDPSSEKTLKPAISKATERRLVIDGEEQYIRDFQATANLYLVRDKQQRPWVVISRLYDSCQGEYGWQKTIERFIMERAKLRGWGVAHAWHRERATYPSLGTTAAGDTDGMRSPKFRSGTGRNNVISHYDDAGVFRMYRDGMLTLLVSEAHIILKPTCKGGEDTDLLPLADFDNRVYGTSASEQFFEAVSRTFVARDQVTDIGGFWYSNSTLSQVGNLLYRFAQERYEAGTQEGIADYNTAAKGWLLDYLRSSKGHDEVSGYGLSLSTRSDAEKTDDGRERAAAVMTLLDGRFAADKWTEQLGRARDWWKREETKRKEEAERRRFDELKRADFLRKMQEVNQMFVAQRAAAPAGVGAAAG